MRPRRRRWRRGSRLRTDLPGIGRRALLLSALAAGGARAASVVARVALVPRAGLLAASVEIDGTAALMTVDTGAERSLLSSALVARLGLPIDSWVSTGLQGVGGTERLRHADVGRMTLGGTVLHRRPLSGVGSIAVEGKAHPIFAGAETDGLLGMDLLGAYDLDFDLAAPALAVGDNLPVPDGLTRVPIETPRPGVVVAPVRIGRATLRALIDTGAAVTVIDSRAADRLGFATVDAGQRLRGVGSGAAPVRAAVPDAMALGGALWRAPPIVVGRLPRLGFEMALGLDVLRGHRMLLSYRGGSLFIA